MDRAEVTSITFDSTGQLFALGMALARLGVTVDLGKEKTYSENTSSLQVFNFDTVVETCAMPSSNGITTWAPLVKLQRCVELLVARFVTQFSTHRVGCLVWNAWRSDEIWTASGSSRELHG